MARITITLLLAIFAFQGLYCQTGDFSFPEFIEFFKSSRCTDKVKITDRDIPRLFTSDVGKEWKCIASCQLEFFGIVDGCDLVSDESKYNFFNEDHKKITLQYRDKCEEQLSKSTDPCECGFQISKCIFAEFLKEMAAKIQEV